MTKLLTAILILIFLPSNHVVAQDDVAKKLIEALERIQTLKDEIAELKNDNRELTDENEKLKEELASGKIDNPRNDAKGKKEPKDKIDYLAVGTEWSGRLDGNNPKAAFRSAANGTVTARTKEGFQIRLKHNGIEWLWICKSQGKNFKVVDAELLAAPANFGNAIGKVLVNSSEVVLTTPSGMPRLSITVVYPVDGGGGVNATYTLGTDKKDEN